MFSSVGAFKLLPLLIKNGIDNVEKFQKTSPEYLNTLGVNNGQIYQAKLKSALVTLLPALAFAQARKTNKKSVATSTESTATDTGTAPKGNSAEQKKQSPESSSAVTNDAPSDSIKAQTELKLFILSANLPLQFANLMFEVSTSCTTLTIRLTNAEIAVCPCHITGWCEECASTPLHRRPQGQVEAIV